MLGTYVVAKSSAAERAPGRSAIGKIVTALLASLCLAPTIADAGALKSKQLEALWAVDGRTRDSTIMDIAACLEALNTPPGQGKGGGPAVNAVCGNEPTQFSFAPLNHRPSGDHRQTLQSLGRLLNRPEARQLRLRIVGHALCSEISARDPYAMKLTFRRAKSVAELLSRTGRVDGDRLIAEGRGYFEPLETAATPTVAQPKENACKAVTTDERNARAEFAIDTPIGLPYGHVGNREVSPLGGADPVPRGNQPPGVVRTTAVAAASPTDNAARYFPAGLQPGPVYSLSLSRVAAHFEVPLSSASTSNCAGFRTGWLSLPAVSNLDDKSGVISLRLRTVLVRAGDRNHGRDTLEVFLDIDGREDAKSPGPSFAGYWTMRERVVLALQWAMSGSGYKDGSGAALPRSPGEGWGSTGANGTPDTPADFVRPCGFPGPGENSNAKAWSDARSGYERAIEALPLTPEDLAARVLELNTPQAFVAVRPGYQLCVAPADAAFRQASAAGAIDVQLGFSPETCKMVREFTFSTGRTGLTLGGSSWRISEETALPTVEGDSNANRNVVTRWSDLVDPGRASRVYIFSAHKFLSANESSWVGSHATTDYVVGIRNPVPDNLLDLGLFFAERFRASTDEACIAGSGTYSALAVPGSYQRPPSPPSDPSEQPPDLMATAKAAYTRCATAERFAQITANLPIRVRGESAFVPIGTTWSELASEHGASERSLFKGASTSVAASALFGDRTRAATFTQGAARALPILPGDSIGW